MHKKHFEAFAEEIAEYRATAKAVTHGDKVGIEYAAQVAEEIIAAVALRFNPNFDSARFFHACRKEKKQ